VVTVHDIILRMCGGVMGSWEAGRTVTTNYACVKKRTQSDPEWIPSERIQPTGGFMHYGCVSRNDVHASRRSFAYDPAACVREGDLQLLESIWMEGREV